MSNTKKTPRRMCVGCQELQTKYNLLRIVHTPDGEFVFDETGKKAGRGAYICPRMECFEKAFNGKKFEKAFKCNIDNKVYAALKARLLKNE